MKIPKLLGLTVLFLFVFNSLFAARLVQWDDDVVKTYEISNFTKIHLEGGYKVILEQADKPGLRIKADEEAFKYIDVDCDATSMNLKISKNNFDFERVTLYISFVNLEEIYINGGVKLETKGYIDLTALYLKVEGGAKIEMEVKADNIKLVGEGGVNFVLRGVTSKLDVHISGAGYLEAEDLQAEQVIFEIEGVGAGSVFATETLKATIEGLGKIKYKGHPIVEKNIEGIGVVDNN